jgi:hypothetical protein
MLGKFLKQFAQNPSVADPAVMQNALFFDRFEQMIHSCVSYNGWFTEEQVRHALASWSEALTIKNLNQWLSAYDLSEEKPGKVGLILAGNIPLVGFHDLICVLVTGNSALVKLSSADQKLLPLLAEYLQVLEPELGQRILFVKDKLTGYDAVIATGSNNTARYFEYYFKDKPTIIRKNRNSAAILTGKETKSELEDLAEDMFRYFGLGCRSVSKVFVPAGYDFKDFFEAVYVKKDLIEYEKYANNYDYNKAVFLMSNFKLLDNGFMTLKEDTGYASPISSVFYEYYDDLEILKKRLEQDHEQLQCLVSGADIKGSLPFGSTQKPMLWDYADNVDTIRFLQQL